jgi:hypothetical protein
MLGGLGDLGGLGASGASGTRLGSPSVSSVRTGGRSRAEGSGGTGDPVPPEIHQSNSPSLTPPTKALHSLGVNASAGPSGSLESRMR